MYNHQLTTFIQAANAGSFTKAAESLYISPNAVIKQINLLETHLGLTLFDRTNHGIELTAAGKSLYRDAKYMIQYSKDSLLRAKNATKENNHTIRIGTSLMTPTRFLVDLWPQVQKLCPDLKFELVPFDNTPENAREIMRNFGDSIDLVAGICDPNFVERRSCAILTLYEAPILCAVSVHHPLAQKKKLVIRDLYGENLMILRRDYMRSMDILRNDIEENYPQITITDFPFYDVSVFNTCENSRSILTTIPGWENVHPMLKLLPVEWEYRLPFGIMYSPFPSENVTRFIQAIQTICVKF